MARKPAACLYCFEHASTDHRPDRCREYAQAVAFAKRVRRLLADETPWHAKPVPQADYTSEARAVRALVPQQSTEAKAFHKAVRALGPEGRRDPNAPMTVHRGACAQCLYDAGNAATEDERWTRCTIYGSGRGREDCECSGCKPNALAPIPHTCGKATPAAIPTTPRRRKAA